MKKVLSFILALCMICTLLPATVLAADTEVVFTMGADGSASHIDGSSKTTYSETVNGYTLTLSNVSNFYTGARDAKGNGCIKLGASSKAGSFSFTVPADVTSVVIAIAKYKSNTTKISINNGATQTLNKNSNDGAYDEITVDTTSIKTVSLKTLSGGYRAMVNSITFVIAASGSSCEHKNVTTTVTKAPSCTATGEEEWECEDCGETGTNTLDKVDHSLVDVEGYAATCTEDGLADGKACENCDYTEQKVIPALGHNYVDGICSRCDEEMPEVTEETYIFSNYTAGTQYAENEEHKLSDIVTMYTTDCHFTTQLRIYSSSTYNGYAIVKSTLPIASIAFNAGNKVDTLNIYGRNADTEDWVLIQGVSITATSYMNYGPVEISPNYTQLKLDVAGTQQVRIQNMTLTFDASGSEEEEVPATAIFNGAADDISGNVGDSITMPGYNGSVLKGYTFAGWAKNVVEGEAQNVAFVQAGVSYTLTGDDAFYALFSRTVETGSSDDFKLYTGELVEGDYLITGEGATHAMVAENETENGRFGFVAVTAVDNVINTTDSSIIWHIAPTGTGYYTFYNAAAGKYAGGSGVANKGALLDSVDDFALWCIENGAIENKGNENKGVNYTLRSNDDNGFATYAAATGEAPVFYKLVTEITYYTTNPKAVVYTNGSDVTKYDSWNVELNAVTSGTITLMDDITADVVTLGANVVLNLNGKTLTAGAIAGTVMDSANGEGLVKVAQGSAVLSSVDGQMLLWDNNASGYRVYKYSFNDRGVDADGTDAEQTATSGGKVVSFWSDLDFDESYAYQLVASTYSGLNVGFKLELNGVEETFWLSEETQATVLKGWGDSKHGNTNNEIDYFFYVTVTGFAALQEDSVLNVTPVVKDYNGKVVEAGTIEYEFVAG